MHPAHKDIALVAALGRIRPPDHLCSIYETADEQHAVVMPFMRLGLERGEKCIYIAQTGAEYAAYAAMQSYGIDVDAVLARDALIRTTKDRAYLEHGVFDPQKMFAFWRQAADDARREGGCP
jgi:chemotaxis family two-component system sensor kinase Cph1